MKHYTPLEPGIWQGRVDDPRDIDSYRWHQWVKKLDLSILETPPFMKSALNFCFLGFQCDIGVQKNLGRIGAAKAPNFIRKEMSNFPLSFNRDIKLFDAGDLFHSDGSLETTHHNLAALVNHIISLNLFPVILGGGHEVAFGHYRGVLDAVTRMSPLRSPRIGIINFDAHFDLRPYPEGPNSGSMFRQISDLCGEKKIPFSYFCIGIQRYGNTISLFKKAAELKTHYFMAKDIDEKALPAIAKALNDFIAVNDYIYLTICSDVFSSAFAPGVSAPQPFGLQPEIVLKLVKHILRKGKTISFDIAEVAPRFDEDNRTAKLAAIIIFALINTLSECNISYPPMPVPGKLLKHRPPVEPTHQG